MEGHLQKSIPPENSDFHQEEWRRRGREEGGEGEGRGRGRGEGAEQTHWRPKKRQKVPTASQSTSHQLQPQGQLPFSLCSLPSSSLLPSTCCSTFKPGPGCSEPGLCLSTGHAGHAPLKSHGTFLLWLSIPRNAERVN